MSPGQDAVTEYRPRRVLIKVADPIDDPGPARVGVPAFEPSGSAASVPRTQWIAPVGPPVVADLASSPRRAGAISGAMVARELDRLLLIRKGKILRDGPPAGVLEPELIRTAFELDRRLPWWGER